MKDEKDISAQKEAEKQGARVPPEDEDAGRKKDPEKKKGQGQKENFRVTAQRDVGGAVYEIKEKQRFP